VYRETQCQALLREAELDGERSLAGGAAPPLRPNLFRGS